MASTIKGITVSIGGDTTNLKKSLDSVDKTSKDLQRELNLVNRELKFNPDSATLLAQKQEILAEKVNATREKLNKLNEVQEQVERQAKSGDLGAEEYRAYQREVEKTKSQLGYLENELGKTGEKFNEVQRRSGNVNFKNAEDKVDHLKGKFKDLTEDASKNLDAFSKKAEKIGDGLDKAGGVLNKTSAAGAAVLAGSVASFKDLDNGYDTIVKKTGATNDELEKLKGIADDLFSNNSFDMQAIGSAIGEINTRFGYTDEKLKSVTETYLQFAKINDTDVSQSVAKSSQIVQAWNLSAEQIPDLLGLITGKAQETGISADILMDKVLANNATFKEMGLSLEESVGLMAQFEKNGVNDSTALAALKAAVKNATKEGKSLSEALQENVADIKNAKTDTEALQAATKLFGSKGAAEMANAIKEGRINFDDLSSSMGDYKDTVKNTYKGTLDPLEKSKKGLNNLKLAGAELANVALKEGEPLVDDVVKWIKSVTEGIKKLNPEQKQMLIKAIEIVAVAGPAVKITGGIAKGISSIAGIIPKAVNVIKGMTSATKAAETAQIGLNAAQSASPVGALITILGLVAAAVTTYYLTTDEATEKAKFLSKAEAELYSRIDENVNKWNELKDARAKSSKEVESQYGYYEELTKRLKNITDESGRIKKGYESEADVIVNTLNKAFDKEYKITDDVIQNYQSMQTELSKLIQMQKAKAQQEMFEDSYKEAITNRTQAWKDINESEKNIQSIQEKIINLREKRKRMSTGHWEQTSIGRKWVSDPKKQLEYDGLLVTISSYESQLAKAKDNLKNQQETYLEYINTIQNYEDVTAAIASNDSDKVESALNKMTNNFLTAKNATREMLEEQLSNAETNFESIKTAFDSKAPGITQSMVNNASELVRLSKAELDKMPNNASSATQAAVNAVKNEKVNFYDAGNDLGTNANQGFSDGMTSEKAIDKIKEAAKNIFDAFNKTVTGFFEIHSPSRVAFRLGSNVGGTFGDGIISKLKQVKKASLQLSGAAKSSLSLGAFDYSGIKSTYASIGKLRNSGIAKTQSRVNNINNSTSKSINGGVNVTINQAKLDTDADVERMGEKLADIIIRKGMEWG